MSQPTHKTYRFRTFQELVDVVPPERIRDCMTELTTILTVTANTTVALYALAKDLHGKEVPEADRRLVLPEVLEWIDDGKGELRADFSTMDGQPVIELAVSKDGDLNVRRKPKAE